MKKYILPLLSIALFSMTSCNEEAKTSGEEVVTQTETTAADVNMPAPEVATEPQSPETGLSPEALANPTTMKVDRMEHDFGTITQDKPVVTTFTITNTGKNPLVISSAKGSCGCTVPKVPSAPLAPGASEKIEVSFDPKGKPGANAKTVTIIANTEPATTILNLKSLVN